MDMLTEPRLDEIFRYVFKLPADTDVSAATQDDLPEWDSLAHATLVLALESEFGIEIDAADSLALTSYEAVARFLQESGA